MKILYLYFIFQTIIIPAQTKVKITDAENQNSIPYATIIFKNSNTYKSAENDGTIEISKDENIVEIQAFGYETLKVHNFQNVYSLKPIYKNINNLEIYKSQNTIHIRAGKIKKEIFKQSLGSNSSNLIILNLFNYKSDYPKLTFIKKIRFLSDVDYKESATINIVLYKNTEGKPSGEVWESFLVICKKGKNISELSLENKNIVFPKEGIFIGFEWILNNENKYLLEKHDGRYQKEIVTGINPQILTQKNSETNIFVKSKIEHNAKNQFKFPNNDNRSLSIELDLSN